MTQPQVQWTTPAPLWPSLAGNSAAPEAGFRRPTILRFASDDFMDEFMNVVATRPGRLGEWQATPETWRGPATTPVPVETLPTFAQRLHRLRLRLAAVAEGTAPPTTLPAGAMIPAGELKLYQPAHQRFYLITACLVCRVPGLPDRLLNNNQGEQTSFVVRRLRSSDQPGATPTLDTLDQFDESAFVLTPQGGRWQSLGPAGGTKTQTLAFDEEQLPLFGVSYPEAETGTRRLLAGVIPVGKREAYVGAPTIPADGNGTEAATTETTTTEVPDPRLAQFMAEMLQPWDALKEQHDRFQERQGTEAELLAKLAAAGITDQDEIDAILDEYHAQQAQMADQVQSASWYILLDFADVLAKYLPGVWAALPDGSGSDLSPAGQDLLAALQDTANEDGRTLAEAVADIVDYRDELEETAVPYESDDSGWPPAFSLLDETVLADLDPAGLEALLDEALAEVAAPAGTPPLPLAAQQSAVDMGEPAWFIIRCVFSRPHCVEQTPVLVSPATAPFQMANFFDPEAPARPIRISLPLDTSPAGLRKFSKNTAFVISDVLACQMERVGDLSLGDLVLSVLPWPFHKPLPEAEACSEGPGLGLGMICSLSIPIITICALILLMIMVTLLDMIFRWIPYFILCFPLPSLKGKESS